MCLRGLRSSLDGLVVAHVAGDDGRFHTSIREFRLERPQLRAPTSNDDHRVVRIGFGTARAKGVTDPGAGTPSRSTVVVPLTRADAILQRLDGPAFHAEASACATG